MGPCGGALMTEWVATPRYGASVNSYHYTNNTHTYRHTLAQMYANGITNKSVNKLLALYIGKNVDMYEGFLGVQAQGQSIGTNTHTHQHNHPLIHPSVPSPGQNKGWKAEAGQK